MARGKIQHNVDYRKVYLKPVDVPAYVLSKTGIQITRQTVYIWLKKGKWSYSRDLIKLRSELRIGYLFTKPEWVDEFLRKVSK